MQENLRKVKLQKAFSVLLIVLFFAFFVASVLLSFTLPFEGVASGYSWDGPTFADLEVGDVIYGIKLANTNFDALSGVKSQSATIYFDGISNAFGGGSTGFLCLQVDDYDHGSFSLFFDFEDYGTVSVLESPIATIYGSYSGEYFGSGFIYFDNGITLLSEYDNSTEASSFLWDSSSIRVLTSPLNRLYYADGFTDRFVTPYNYACQSVFLNLNVYPTIPSSGLYPVASSTSTYLFDYFDYMGSSENITTVGWTILRTSTASYSAVLSIGSVSRGVKLFSCNFTRDSSGAISGYTNQKWLVSGNVSDTLFLVYKYDLAGQDKYFALNNNDSNSFVVSEQKSGSVWGNWLALADIYNLPMLDNNLTYNAGFDSGYQSGFFDGTDSGKSEGYNAGYSDGSVAGYNKGYQAGKDVSGDYTFMGLLGAVFDAPIEAFKGLFNFEILGVNMQGFVVALLTLSVIIIIIKIALGGK